MILVVIIGAAIVGSGMIAFVSMTFTRRMDAIDRARDRAELGGRIAALELELGLREMTDDEVIASEKLGPHVVIDDKLREYATVRATKSGAARFW